MPISTRALDASPDLLNVRNGTIDLRTGELLKHDPANLLTKLVDISYDPSATAERWENFVSWAMSDDDETVAYIQRALGYSATGHTSERVLFILHGIGRNGKSVMIETVQDVLGPYAITTPVNTIVERRDAATNDLARLKGARFVSASELEGDQKLSSAVVKRLTGNDTITARFLYAEHFEFRPEMTMWLATNNKPKADTNDVALWDRIRLVPFERRVTESERDPNLRNKLLDESAGVLSWIVRGAVAWHRSGLGTSPIVAEATESYREDEDRLHEFLADWCDDTGLGNIAELYRTYRYWAELYGRRPVPVRTFNARIEAKGYLRVMIHGERLWKGLSLLDEQQRGYRFEEDAEVVS